MFLSGFAQLQAKVDLRTELENALGSGSWYGHARMTRHLGDLPMGREQYRVNLVFDTNPADTPGAFGPYWRIPLFASTAVQASQYELAWHGPDERRQFFARDRSYDAKRGETVFIERGKDWQATVSRRGAVHIESLTESGWSFRYEDGQLIEFQMGESAERCRITYSGRGLPLYITNQATNRRIFEIEYRGATEPVRILIGEQQIAVQMGDADLTSPDGVSNYRNHRVSFLRQLSFGADDREYFSYTKGATRQRTVALSSEAKKKSNRALDLAINRMSIARVANGPVDDWIEWEAKSGFVTADSGASYEVANRAWDPNIVRPPFGLTPIEVAIKRFPEGGSEQRWSCHWKTGVRVYTDLATGEIVRRTEIKSEGPANGKLRKREVLKGGQWTLDRKNSYDPKGRPVRAVHGNDMRIWEWEDRADGSESTEYLNGSLVRRTVYDVAGGFLEREIFKPNGDVDRYIYGRNDYGRTIAYFMNGEAMTYKELDGQGHLSYMKWANGKEQFHSREDGAWQIMTVFPDGRRRLVERVSEGASFAQVESAEIVAQTLQKLRSRRPN